MLTTENQIKLEVKKWATAHGQINDFFWGEPLRSWKENVLNFPVLIGYFSPSGDYQNNLTGLQMTIIVADKVYKDDSNLDEVWSDTNQIGRDFFQAVNKSNKWRNFGKVSGTPNYTRFQNDTGDEIAGVAVQFTLNLRDQSGICDIPTFGYDYESTGSTPIDCLPATIFNSSVTYLREVASGGFLELPDETIIVTDENDNVIDTIVFPVYENQIIELDSYCSGGPTEITYTINVNGIFNQSITLSTLSDEIINITA